ncbi:MAG TPA: HAD-IIIA family hydrolase [Chthoniobacterales bacterium]|nr:HAD-IIIA family hydrolase [Chthoniobacterales bacterium]
MGKHPVERSAVFLDRDGVLNRPLERDGFPGPPLTVAEFELYNDVADGCARLKAAGYLLVVVTNQPDVGRGTQTRAEVDAMNAKLLSALPMIDRIEVCFHAGSEHGEPCLCRKPQPGMLLAAAAALQIDLRLSYLIGDRWRDIDCARAAGCRAIFIDCGYREPLRETPDAVVHEFGEAVTLIVGSDP